MQHKTNLDQDNLNNNENEDFITTAETSGEWGLDQKATIYVAKSSFDEGYAFMVNTLGHEYQHVKQRWQNSSPISKAEGEFLAYSWEVWDQNHIRLDKIDYYSEVYYKAKNYYKELDNELKEKYFT